MTLVSKLPGPGRRNRLAAISAALTVAAGIVWVGCRKEEPATVSQPTPPPAKQSVENLMAIPPAPPPPAPAETPAIGAAQGSDVTVEVANLTIELRIFVSQKKRFPADLNELSHVSGMQLPVPPKGSRLVIDKESKSVKLVGTP
jgi:hypothetical protein